MDVVNYIPVCDFCLSPYILRQAGVIFHRIGSCPDLVLFEVLSLKFNVVLSIELLQEGKRYCNDSIENVSDLKTLLPLLIREKVRPFNDFTFEKRLNQRSIYKEVLDRDAVVLL